MVRVSHPIAGLPREPRPVECCGRALLFGLALEARGGDADFLDGPASGEGAAANAADRVVFEDDVEYLRGLDPKEWKEQDHYAVLGVGKLRWRATDDDIKRAYRLKVLRHHPDKRKANGEKVLRDEDYFACITKAYEILGTPLKRRSYDSVDPEFDDTIPTQSDLKRGDLDFFATFGPAFEANARWSERRNPPALGDAATAREDVDRFYNFWYDFESWREYSYHDEEEKEKGQDREERRWIEKQNRAVRAKKKKEEAVRIRQLVDLAYNNDPRIVKFKQEDKDKKLAAKKARQDAAQARRAEEEKQLEEARIAKEQAEKEEKARAELARAEKENVKRQLKKERKIFRDLCKSKNYYIESDAETIEFMSAVEKICEAFSLLEIQKVNRDLPQGGRQTFVDMMQETERRLEAERMAQLERHKSDDSKASVAAAAPAWTPELINLLIKSVNFFPAGTNQRWEVIANFVNQHGKFDDARRFSAKDVLNKAKDLQSSDFSKSSLKVAANREAFDKFEKEKKKPVSAAVDDAEISKSFDSKKVVAAVNGTSEPEKTVNGNGVSRKSAPTAVEKQEDNKKEDVPWSKVEQELLEQAIKTYPVNTPERWDRISECIPNRSKKDCMKRFKELVDLVKAKKAAAQINK